jgi:hypothetical protein
MSDFRVTLTFTDDVLGTASANPDLYGEFIASKAPEGTAGAEIEALPVEEEVEKQTTVFPRTDDGHPFIYDYQIKGFFKDACGMLRRVDGTHSKKLKAYKKEIDGLIFIGPRQIPFGNNGDTTICERPLRASTPKGDRVALARSESVPAGATLTFTIDCLRDGLIPCVEEWLEYGQLRGLGQWRNSGKGRFTCVIE